MKLRRTPKSIKVLREFSQLLLGADEWEPPWPVTDVPNGPVTGWIIDRKDKYVKEMLEDAKV